VAARHGGGKLGLGRAAPGPAPLLVVCLSSSIYGVWWGLSPHVALSTYFATDCGLAAVLTNRIVTQESLNWVRAGHGPCAQTVQVWRRSLFCAHLISSRLLASARNLPGSNYHTRDAGPAGPAEGLDLNEWTTPFGRLELIRLAEQRSRGEHPWRLHVEYRQDDGLAIRRARSQNWPPTGARRWRS
jgi:hypothetical protein